MEQLIQQLLPQLLENFDFIFMFVVNVVTYLIIKLIDVLNKEAPVSTLVKRIVLVVVILTCTITYGLVRDFSIKLINSAIAAPVFYSWVLKPILKKFGINYSTLDDYLMLKD